MSCAFETSDQLGPGPSHNILHPVNEYEAAQQHFPTTEDLKSLEDFCKRTEGVCSFFNMLDPEPQQGENLLEMLERSFVPNSASTPTSLKPCDAASTNGFTGLQSCNNFTSLELPTASQESLQQTDVISTNGFTGFQSCNSSTSLGLPTSSQESFQQADVASTNGFTYSQSGDGCMYLQFPTRLQESLQQTDYDKNEFSDTTPNPDSQRLIQEVAHESSVPSQSFADAGLEKDENGNTKGFVCDDTNAETVTYTKLHTAVPLGNQPFGDLLESAINESNLPDQPITITETEIDEAMHSVFNHLGQWRPQELQKLLDEQIIERCLEETVNRPVLICQSCFRVFDTVAPFQVHVKTCCEPPRIELKTKMDQLAMDVLARGLWKESFLKALNNEPAGPHMLKQEDQLRNELDELWASTCELMIRPRDLFIKAAVAIVTRKWCATAYANELHRLRSRATKAPPKKRPKNEPVEEGNTLPEKNGHPDTKKTDTDCSSTGRYPLRRRGRPKKAMSETEIALEMILAESITDTAESSLQYHFTPETPVSEHGQDVLPASPVLSKRHSKEKNAPDNAVELDCEFRSEIERIVREDEAVNDEAVAAAAKTFESLDDKGNWENGQLENNQLENNQLEEPAQLGEGEYVVREILHRRLINENIGGLPTEEDFEYLVAWDGFGDEENTWEPYEHLKHCHDKLKQFHDRLRAKAMRKRRGKRM